jgi:heat shock protein HspQ
MTLESKFHYEQLVRHRLNEFQGYVISVLWKPTGIEYEVLPLTDAAAKWTEARWIPEYLLEEVPS